MKDRYTMFRRGTLFYCEDRTTGQQKSLLTGDEAEARKIIQTRNEAVKLPQMNLVMAKTYLSAQDPKMIPRTWADVMECFCDRSNDATRMASAPTPTTIMRPRVARPPMIADIALLSEAVARMSCAPPRALSAAAGSPALLSIPSKGLIPSSSFELLKLGPFGQLLKTIPIVRLLTRNNCQVIFLVANFRAIKIKPTAFGPWRVI